MSRGSAFLSRWSRLKKAAAATTTSPSAELPDGEALLANLGPESDFGVFLRAEISEDVRRQAMKKLFADPHYNVMDRLDIYIDDYSLSDPIPEDMLATLNQTKEWFETALEDGAETLPAAPADCDSLAADGQNDAIESAENKPPP